MSVSLSRRFGLLQATALNMSNMIGIGPFITIPILMTALGGPQAMIGWAVAVLVTIPDGLVWSELGAAMPGSGGSYVYLREAYGRERFGRLVAFLFIWQFILSGPLEIASGYIGFSRYARYIWPDLTSGHVFLVAAGVGLLNVVLLYRRIEAIGTLTVSLWLGTLLTTGAVIASGALHFDAARAFDFPPGAFDFSIGFLLGLGAASRVGIYDYLGYYDICYIGDEVKDPGRVIPRSILISIVAVAILYFAINLSIIGVVPWREFVPADAHPESEFIVSTFMERLVRAAGRNGVHVPHPVDGVRIGVRAAPRVFADSVRGRQGRVLFQDLWTAAPDQAFPAHLAACAGPDFDPLQPAAARPGDRRVDHHEDPRAVHRPGVRRDAASGNQARPAAAVSDVAVSCPGDRCAGWLDVSAPDLRLVPDRPRPRHAGARYRLLSVVVVAL